jgi:tetratricopeptide (TPR) repeat protein
MPWLLALVGVLIYSNTFSNDFVFDDEPHIQLDESIRDLTDLPAIVAGSRRPVVKLTLALNYAIDGLNPAGYHAFNIMVHVLAALALFGLVRRILLASHLCDRFAPIAPWFAFSVALLWLVHPLNTQAVSYVIQRGESLMGLFFLLTLYGLVRSATSESSAGQWRWAVVCVTTCLLGMGTKEVMAVAPVVALLLDRAFLAGSLGEALRQRWGLYLGLAATWLILPLMGLSEVLADDQSAGFGLQLVTWWQYLLSQGEVILHYIKMAFWPHPLVFDYLWLPSWFTGRWGPSVALVALLLSVTAVGVVRNTWWGFLGAWFFLILAPTSSIVPIADLAVEHRMYLPLLAIVVGVVAVMNALLHKTVQPSRRRILATLAVLVPAIALAATTLTRNLEYRSPITLWLTVTERAPLNPRAFHNLGSALFKADYRDQAMFAFERALEMVPNYAAAHNQVAIIWLDRGRLDLALPHFRQALEATPDDPEIAYNYGRALLRNGETQAAMAQLNHALTLRPNYAKALNMRGVAYAEREQYAAAIADFRSAIADDPDLDGARQNLAKALIDSGQIAQGIDLFEQVLRSSPDDAMALITLARIRATAPDPALRDGTQAVQLAQRAAALTDRHDVLTIDTLAAAYAEVGRFDEAAAMIRDLLNDARTGNASGQMLRVIESRLQIYESGQALREPVGKAPATSGS